MKASTSCHIIAIIIVAFNFLTGITGPEFYVSTMLMLASGNICSAIEKSGEDAIQKGDRG